jgi:hypothetical protein
VHLHLNKAGVTVQLTETMLAELVNATSIAQRKVEGRPADPVRSPSPSTPTN